MLYLKTIETRCPTDHTPDCGAFFVKRIINRYGLFLATLSGHGRVWLQSLPFSRLVDRVIAHAPSTGGSDKGEGSVLGGLDRLLDGD